MIGGIFAQSAILAEQIDQPPLVWQAELAVQMGTPEIRVDEQHLSSGLGQRYAQVLDNGGFSLSRSGARDQNCFLRFPGRLIPQDRSQSPAERLGNERRPALPGDQSRGRVLMLAVDGNALGGTQRRR